MIWIIWVKFGSFEEAQSHSYSVFTIVALFINLMNDQVSSHSKFALPIFRLEAIIDEWLLGTALLFLVSHYAFSSVRCFIERALQNSIEALLNSAFFN